MRSFEQYQVDEVVDLLREFRFRSMHEPSLVDVIDSVLALLEEQEEEDDE